MISRRLWYALQNPNEQTPLYHYLRNSYRRYQGWASRDFNIITVIFVVFNVLLAPFFGILPILTIFVFGAYWSGYVAGEIQHEHSTHRFDMLALLPTGAMAVYWTLAVLHIRHSGIFHYIMDGLRITALIGSMILFVLISGILIALIDNSTAAVESAIQLLNMTVTLTAALLTLYTQQIQAVVLSQMLGMTVPTHTASTIAARAWGSAIFLTFQLMLYAGVFALVSNVIFPLLGDSHVRWAVGICVGGGILIGVHETVIFVLWRRLNTIYGEINLKALVYYS